MIKQLQVLYDNRLVGTLALTAEHKVAFQYSDGWLQDGFSISPFSLPLKKQVFVPDKMCFGGLFGVFADSLPDAWGAVLMDRFWVKEGHKREELNILERLAMVGDSARGALCYHPVREYRESEDKMDLDYIAEECLHILNSEESKDLDLLYSLGGSSGGARPKVMTEIDGMDMIVKFPTSVDPGNIGRMEYEYSVCAKSCGIEMPETVLLPSAKCDGYFGVKRFDRHKQKKERYHVLTAAALLEADYEQPCLDYHSLMKLTKILTKDNKHDVENMFLRMCFNVLAHNRDDHAKNFSYLYFPEHNLWRLAPAYDLTYSNTFYGEHTISVNGNGRDPGWSDLLEVGLKAGMTKKRCLVLYEMCQSKVSGMLKEYLEK